MDTSFPHTVLDVYVPNVLSIKRFHGVLAGNVHACSRKLSIGTVSGFVCCDSIAVCNADGAKLVKGRKRPILVDTLGWLIAVEVTAASVQDRDGAKCLWRVLRHGLTRLHCMWADGAYAGFWETWVILLHRYRHVRLEISERSEPAKGFVVLPKQWIVERTSPGLGSPGA